MTFYPDKPDEVAVCTDYRVSSSPYVEENYPWRLLALDRGSARVNCYPDGNSAPRTYSYYFLKSSSEQEYTFKYAENIWGVLSPESKFRLREMNDKFNVLGLK